MTGVVLASLASLPPPTVVEYLLVGGGGAGGLSYLAAGGGGGGGEGQNATVIVQPGDNWTITVGAGGTGYNIFASLPSIVLPTIGGSTCISPLGVEARGGGVGSGNCGAWPVTSTSPPIIWSGPFQPSVPPFGGGQGGGGGVCQAAPLTVVSNRFPQQTLPSAGKGGGGCGTTNGTPPNPPQRSTPVFGWSTSNGGCWRVGGGGGSGAVPPANGNAGTTAIFTGGTPPLGPSTCSNLMLCAGAGGDGFTISWAGTFGGGGGGGVRNNIRPNCAGGTPPLFRQFDNRICDNSGPGGAGGGGSGPRFSPDNTITYLSYLTPNYGSGAPNTGGGGAGAGSSCQVPLSPPGSAAWGCDTRSVQSVGLGGSGIAYVRYPANYRLALATTGSPTITVENGYIVYKFTGSGSITF